MASATFSRVLCRKSSDAAGAPNSRDPLTGKDHHSETCDEIIKKSLKIS
jgi:hypothetical protein